MKRFKSFAITAVSLIGTSLVAVVLTPEWATFLQFANDKLLGWGIPAVVVALVGVMVSEIWKGLLNYLTLRKNESVGLGTFSDYQNELY